MAISKELKERWIARLESPEAKWASGVLHNTSTGGMCCLGHLADVAGLWDDARRVSVNGKHHAPDGFFCGLSDDQIEALYMRNDTEGRFPIDMIRALPVAEDGGA